MSSVRVQYLNHACLLVELDGVRLLFDPWLSGTAFSGGWGLRYDNPFALDAAASATHLWISHWHSDHLHAPSLAKLAQRNPDMVVLANVSANFNMVDRMASLGFRHIRPLGERESMRLAEGVSCTRYPTAGIDNMLHLKGPDWSLLNYNDCNLPASAIRALRAELGAIDVLFTNYNHAGKLFDADDDGTRRGQLVDVLRRTVDELGPRWVVPFASSHYYRCAESSDQNRSMLSFDDLDRLAERDARYVVARIGDAVRFSSGQVPQRQPCEPPLMARKLDLRADGAQVPWEQLLREVSARCKRLDRRFLRLAGWLLPDLVVRVHDHARCLRLRPGRNAQEETGPAHIEAHSEALHAWLARRFGDDTFVAGAHFRIVDPDTHVIERWALLTLLEASHLDPRSCLRYLASRPGRRFLWNRREEAWATLAGRRLRAGRMRL